MDQHTQSSNQSTTSRGSVRPSRRRLLQAAAAGTAGIALGGTVGQAWARPGAGGPLPGSAGSVSPGDRAFLRHGLQHLAWLGIAGGSDFPTGEPTPIPIPNAEQFNGSGFTAPCYYFIGPDGMYDKAYQRQLDAGLWSAAQFPESGPTVGPPQPGQRLLTPAMRANRQNFFSACLGDEESYSEDLVGWLRQYFDLLREQSPGTLVYNNQYANQWTDDQLRHYLQTCHPDLLCWDSYYFSLTAQYASGSVTPLYNNTYRYRRLAQEGLDGTGAQPINFGQYTQGYGGSKGLYVLSESQLAVVPYVSWAMGAKQLDLFRWTWQTSSSNIFLLNYPDGRVTPNYYVFAQLNADMQRLSPYLVRLRTSTVGIRRGSYDPAAPKPTPQSQVPDWTATTDPGTCISALDVTNTGGANGGLPGDVLVGSFRTLPGLSAAECGEWVDPNGSAFMLVNALNQPNSDPTSSPGTGGRSVDTRQRIRVTLDLSGRHRRLYRVPAERRPDEEVQLQPAGGSSYTFDVELGGGQGTLFIWR
ncbi:hypothetical protein JOF29_007212 [Kribbella aluminosa]|uniref:Secreted protein n=1 Tax=Kribbella aluminosa TaxID=416017 RepID=A0ABS4UWU3_9ACTN|nr:twin-arginine translocation signal domain-containing protein [Kribbella aluminosa]MBP2356102.1 hypothetical protein [Kribbella aluminosa]